MQHSLRQLLSAIEGFVEHPPPGTTKAELDALGDVTERLTAPRLNDTPSPGDEAVMKASGEEVEESNEEEASDNLSPGQRAAVAGAANES